jgi:hypothetical protein
MMEEEKASESDVMKPLNLTTGNKDGDLASSISYDMLPILPDNKLRSASISTTAISKENIQDLK